MLALSVLLNSAKVVGATIILLLVASIILLMHAAILLVLGANIILVRILPVS